MSEKKIADSIIIRVGGGIREVPRDPVEIAEVLESAHQKPRIEQTDDGHSLGADPGSNAKNKIIN